MEENRKRKMRQILQQPLPNGFKRTGMTKESYLDVIEQCTRAYPMGEMEQMTAAEDIQSYSRLVSSLALLLSAGRMPDYRALWEEMMTRACAALPLVKKQQRLDFSVKELMIAYRLMKGHVSPETRNGWREALSLVTPEDYYKYITGENNNINIYNMAGEALRGAEGMTDASAYFQKCWPVQLEKFDENGMYLDEGWGKKNPILYDLTTRVQMQLILGCGYRGAFAEELDRRMADGGLMTLFMQSAAFQLPYGGRSNQYLFNEALIASNCEYEAVRWKERGDLVLAGAYKRAAHLAIQTVGRWLAAKKHIKNFYPQPEIGCEGYGYYTKYMITLGSFLAIGCLYADDTIEELPCPAELGGYVLTTSAQFNKMFANCGGYSVELDADADFQYDSTGLGRVHKAGVPTELGLSLPFTATPSYTVATGSRAGVPNVHTANLAIGPGWMDGGKEKYFSEQSGMAHSLEILGESPEQVSFRITYQAEGASMMKAASSTEEASINKEKASLQETYTIDSSGVTIDTMLSGAEGLCYRVPLLVTNGLDTTQIETGEHTARVVLSGHCYTVSTNGRLTVPPERYANRNGEYRAAHIVAPDNTLHTKLSLQ